MKNTRRPQSSHAENVVSRERYLVLKPRLHAMRAATKIDISAVADAVGP